MMKLNSSHFKKGHVPFNKRDWTTIDAVIREKYPSSGAQIVSNLLNVSKNIIHLRASKIGIKCCKKYLLTDDRKQRISTALKKVVKTKEWKENLSKSLRGKKHSKERIEAIIKGVVRSRKEQRGMTKPEKSINALLGFIFSPYKVYVYTGDRKFFIPLSNGSFRCPDFLNEFDHKIIEVFGRYWHKYDDVDEIIKAYKEVGYECLVIWEDEIDINTRDNIMKFTCPEIYEDELWEVNHGS